MDIDTPDDYEKLQRAEEAVSRRDFVGAALVGGALMSMTTVEAQTPAAAAGNVHVEHQRKRSRPEGWTLAPRCSTCFVSSST